MTCEQVAQRFSDYLENSLSLYERQQVEDHLAACQDCSNDLARFTNTVSVLRGLDAIVPPEDLLSRIEQALDAAPAPVPVPVSTETASESARQRLREHLRNWRSAWTWPPRWSWQQASALAVAACALIGLVVVLRQEQLASESAPTVATAPQTLPQTGPTGPASGSGLGAISGRSGLSSGTVSPGPPGTTGTAPSTPGPSAGSPTPATGTTGRPPGMPMPTNPGLGAAPLGRPGAGPAAAPGVSPGFGVQPGSPSWHRPGGATGPTRPTPVFPRAPEARERVAAVVPPGRISGSAEAPTVPPRRGEGEPARAKPTAPRPEPPERSAPPVPSPAELRDKALGGRATSSQAAPRRASESTPAAGRQVPSPAAATRDAEPAERPLVLSPEELRAKVLGGPRKKGPEDVAEPGAPPVVTSRASTGPRPLTYAGEGSAAPRDTMAADSAFAEARTRPAGVYITFLPPNVREVGRPTTAAVVIDSDRSVERVTVYVEPAGSLRVTNASNGGVVYDGPLTGGRRQTLALELVSDKPGRQAMRIGLSSNEPAANTTLDVMIPDFVAPTASQKETLRSLAGGEVSLVFRETEIREALMIVAQRAGLRLELGPDVGGVRVNMELYQVPGEAALRVLCQEAGYYLHLQDGVYTVTRP